MAKCQVTLLQQQGKSWANGVWGSWRTIFFVTNYCLCCTFLTFLDQTSQDQANTPDLDGDDTQGQLLLYPSQISHHLMCSFHCISGQTWITIKEREEQIKVGAKKTIFTAGHSNKLKLAHVISTTGGPSSLHERGRDSCLRAVLCYKRLFIKACMGCKRFFLKERKNVVF